MPTIETHHGAYIVRGGPYGRGRGTLIQTDWEYPATARDCGWSLTRVQRVLDVDCLDDGPAFAILHLSRRPTARAMESRGYCEHAGTDGTVACRDCGLTAGEFISAAAEYLDSIAT